MWKIYLAKYYRRSLAADTWEGMAGGNSCQTRTGHGFQSDAVFPWYTVRQNVEYGLKTQNTNTSERKGITDHILQLVGLTKAQNLFPRQLSGGMRKRVDVARALAIKPEVLLMDEPFAALDVLTKGKLQEEFLNIWNNNRMTVIFVTHDLEEAIYLSDRVVVMSNHPDVSAGWWRYLARPRIATKTIPEFQTLRRDWVTSSPNYRVIS
jgi:NitT/TauT family transport system ATP-binding protein